MSCQHSRLTPPRAIHVTFAALPFLFATQAWAAPHSHLARRAGNGGGSKVVAPIIAALVFLLVVPMVFYRKTLLSKFRHVAVHSMLMRQRPSSTTVIRDLTAEEIAGTNATNQANAATTTRTERRARRNRRTPSQISTRSLPAYMKEPGEHELVIIQGSQDMEDAPLTAQVVMPSVTEDEDESANSHSRNPSQASSYVIVNVNDDPHVQTPLLQTDESNESADQHQNPNPRVPPGTVDISDLLYIDPSSPLPDDPGFADPRGEAPPYFEVVGLSDVRAASGDLARIDTTDTLPIAPDTLPASNAEILPVRRRSMFRGLIDAASRALSSPHSSAPHVSASRPSRSDAVSSPPRPSNLSNRPVGSRSPLVGHHTTPSNSGSVLSVTSSAIGARSRSVSNIAGGLTSPSALSITSISAPLRHTVVRTDFVYPRSGPTPEQLKLISSVESVSKFGVPYGPDAVAYASASLVNLHGPPPEFEERPSVDSLPGPSAAATRERPTSTLSRVTQDDNMPESRLSFSSLASASGETTVPSASAADEPEAAASHPELDVRSHVPIPSDVAPAPELEPPEEKKEQEGQPVETIPPRAPSPSPTVETTCTAATVTKATASELGAVAGSLDRSATLGSRRPALPSFDSESMTTITTTRTPIGPSSFRMPSAPSGHTHAASRSSSIDTFRTAASKFEQGRGSERETSASDTEHETDAFTDAESGAETPPATPHAISVGSTVLGPEPPSLSV